MRRQKQSGAYTPVGHDSGGGSFAGAPPEGTDSPPAAGEGWFDGGASGGGGASADIGGGWDSGGGADAGGDGGGGGD